MNQPSLKPTNKVAAGGIAGAILTAIIAVCSIFGIAIPSEVSDAALVAVAAITTIVHFVAAYLKREG